MEFFVKRDGAKLFCRRQGSGPDLLLVHGVVCDSDYFEDAAKILSEHFTVMTYDRRGYSRSECAEGADYSVKTQGEDAATVIRAVGESAYVVGCSAGGIISLELARKHPELVKKLALHEPPVANTPAYREELHAWLADLRDCAERRRTARALISFVNELGGIDPAGKRRSLEEQQRDMKTLPVFLYHEMESLLQYLPEGLETIELFMPATVMVGTDDPEGLFHRACEPAAKMLGAKLMPVGGCHNFALDRPEEFACAVQKIMTE